MKLHFFSRTPDSCLY